MRMFVAVNLTSVVKRELERLSRRLAATGLPVRWVPPGNYHLTLRWLGEQSDAARPRIVEVLEEAAAGAAPFEIRFGSVGAFPSPRRPRVIWIAIDAGPALRVLRDGLERSLAAEGFERDGRSFRPHVTLGRATSDASPGAFRAFAASTPGLTIDAAVTIRSLDLMRSRVSPGGAQYERLDRLNLGRRTLPPRASRA
ncbi:MAG: RNA 2',3'-cyclic phosphodiesterase [Gemmatimonadota bacterium]